MDPTSAPDEDQSEAERLEVARRYRELHTRELRDAAQQVVGGEVEAVGEFATLPFASYAAVPLFGAFFALGARWRAKLRSKLPERMMLALDGTQLYALERLAPKLNAQSPIEDPRNPELSVAAQWPRDSVRVTSVADKFLSTEVVFDTGEDEPLRLYAPKLRNNPWSSEVVRLLGGDAPAPRELS